MDEPLGWLEHVWLEHAYRYIDAVAVGVTRWWRRRSSMAPRWGCAVDAPWQGLLGGGAVRQLGDRAVRQHPAQDGLDLGYPQPQ